MGKGRLRDGVFGAMKPICNCFSVAVKQAREAEIDVPSKWRFRQRILSGEGSSAIPQDAGTGLHAVATRTAIGLRTFLDCVGDARHRVQESRNDAVSRKTYRRLPE